MNIQIANSNEAKSDKKPYQSPELFVYGNIREITQAVDMIGMDDGAMGNDKT